MFEQPSIAKISRFGDLPSFYRLVEPEAKIVSARWFRSVANEGSRIGHGRFNVRGVGETIDYVEFNIFIDRDALTLPRADYSPLIPVMIRHEVAELFQSVNIFRKIGITPLSPLTNLILGWTRDEAHAFALDEEHRLARSLGVSSLHQEFFTEYASAYSDLDLRHIVQENSDAYIRVSQEG